MKKITKTTLTLSFLLALTGCGSSDSDVTTISIGTSPDYPPYESYAEDNKTLVGFDVDMVEILEGYMNEGETKYELEFVPMSFDTIVTQLQADQLDLGISGFSYSEDRKVEWSTPYCSSSQVIIVPTGSNIKSIDDLDGKVIGTQSGSTGEEAANTVKGAKVITIADVKLLFENLRANQYDAIVTDYSVGKNYVENADFEMLDDYLLEEENFIVAKEGNTEIIKIVNEAVEKFIASDDYIKLTDKYGIKPVTQ